MVAYLLVLPLGRGEESRNLRVTYSMRTEAHLVVLEVVMQ